MHVKNIKNMQSNGQIFKIHFQLKKKKRKKKETSLKGFTSNFFPNQVCTRACVCVYIYI